MMRTAERARIGVLAAATLWRLRGPELSSAGAAAGRALHVRRTLPAATAAADRPGGAAQHFLAGQDVPRNWWTLFGSADLDALVTEALRANPDVHAAQAALRQALENTAAQRGTYFPDSAGQFDASRNRDAVGVLAPTLTSGAALYNLFTPQVTVIATCRTCSAPIAARWSRWRRRRRRAAFSSTPPI